jgi:membrane protein DedA with SNARE-associated domain
VIVMLESAGIPMPGETILVTAAVYAATKHALDIRWVIAAAAGGAILGDNIGFWVGREFGEPLLEKWGHLVGLDARKRMLGRYLFARYGGSIVFFGRFVALLRAFAALLAGANGLSPWRFYRSVRAGKPVLSGSSCCWFQAKGTSWSDPHAQSPRAPRLLRS